MGRRQNWMTRRLALWACAVLFGGSVVAGCNQIPCADEKVDSSVNVAGTYRYSGFTPGYLTGTISFEQEGSTVRIVETTYDFTNNREVIGEATLNGNRLAVELTPSNGDTDYKADVTFIFSEDGRTFCVEFSDTNGDAGDLGSFTGERI